MDNVFMTAQEVIAKVQQSDLEEFEKRLQQDKIAREDLRRQRKTTHLNASELLQKLAGTGDKSDDTMQVRSQQVETGEPPEPRKAGPSYFPPPPQGLGDVPKQ